MIERGFMFVAGLSFKALLVLATGISSTLGIVIGEGMTKQWGSAGLAGAIASALTVGLLVIPRIMEQRRKSRLTNAEINEQTTQQIISRLTQVHTAELEFFKRRLDEKDLIATLERKGKHKAVNEWTGALAHISVIEAQLKEAGLPPAKAYQPKSYAEIVGDGDQRIEDVQAARVKESNGH